MASRSSSSLLPADGADLQLDCVTDRADADPSTITSGRAGLRPDLRASRLDTVQSTASVTHELDSQFGRRHVTDHGSCLTRPQWREVTGAGPFGGGSKWRHGTTRVGKGRCVGSHRSELIDQSVAPAPSGTAGE